MTLGGKRLYFTSAATIRQLLAVTSNIGDENVKTTEMGKESGRMEGR
jgi:hypothetical protein